MKKNESGMDRGIRAIIGIVALILAFVVGFSSVLGWILLIVAVIALFTAITGFCALYRVFGIATNKK